MTHTLKVSQLARTIAGSLLQQAKESNELRDLIIDLGGLDASVAEAAALAHDLGHPPFGHSGEKVLDQYSQELGSPIQLDDGFEGNAQSFRIAVKADPMYGYQFGLDLTAATNAAILKYPWRRPTKSYNPSSHLPQGATLSQSHLELRKRKFSVYSTEQPVFEEVRNWLPSEFNQIDAPRQTLEASIMDIADDITYAVHDFEDFLSRRYLTPDAVMEDLRSLSVLEAVPDRHERPAVQAMLQEMSGYEVFDLKYLSGHARNQMLNLRALIKQSTYRREFRNSILDTCVKPGCVVLQPDPRDMVGAHVKLHEDPWHLVEMLKFLVKFYVINSEGLGAVQLSQGAILRAGLRELSLRYGADDRRLPAEFRERMDDANRRSDPEGRVYLDYLCTFGDVQFQQFARIITGAVVPGFYPNGVME